MSVHKFQAYHESPVFIERVAIMEPLCIFCGVLSVIASLAVCTTGYLFPSMWKNKIYMQMIIMVSLLDLFASLGSSFGFPTDKFACELQGFLLFFFYRGVWMWSIYILVQLNSIVKNGKVVLTFSTMMWIFLCVNIVIEILPIAFGTFYGVAPSLSGKTFCSFNVYGHDFFLWVCACFVGPLLITVATMIGYSLLLYNRIRHISSAYRNKMVRMTLLYPAVMMVAWLPLAFFYFSHFGKRPGSNHSEAKFIDDYTIFSVIYAWTSLDGFFVGIVFFVNSKEARQRWYNLLKQVLEGGEGNLLKDRAATQNKAKNMARQEEGRVSGPSEFNDGNGMKSREDYTYDTRESDSAGSLNSVGIGRISSYDYDEAMIAKDFDTDLQMERTLKSEDASLHNDSGNEPL